MHSSIAWSLDNSDNVYFNRNSIRKNFFDFALKNWYNYKSNKN